MQCGMRWARVCHVPDWLTSEIGTHAGENLYKLSIQYPEYVLWSRKEAKSGKDCHVKFKFQNQFWEKLDELTQEMLPSKHFDKIAWTNKINSLEWTFPKAMVDEWLPQLRGQTEARQHGEKIMQGCLAYCRILVRSCMPQHVNLDTEDMKYEKKINLVARRKEFAAKIPKSVFPRKKKYRQREKQTEYEEALAVHVANLLVEDSDPLDLKYSEEAYIAAMKKAIQAMEGSFVISSEEEDVKEMP